MMPSARLLLPLIVVSIVSLSTSQEGQGNGPPNELFDFVALSREAELPTSDGEFLREGRLFLAAYSVQEDSFPSACALNASLSVRHDPENTVEYDDTCLLAIVGADEKIQLVSNTVQTSGTADAFLTFVVDETGKVELPSEQFYKQLDRPVVIAGVILFSTGPCEVSNDEINVTLCSNGEISSGFEMSPINVTALLSPENVNSVKFDIIALERLSIDKIPFVPEQQLNATAPSTTIAPSTVSSTSNGSGATTIMAEGPEAVVPVVKVVVPIVASLVVITLVCIIIIVLVYMCYRYTQQHNLRAQRQKNSIARQYEVAKRLKEPFLGRPTTDSLRTNPAYTGFRLISSMDSEPAVQNDYETEATIGGYTEMEIGARASVHLERTETGDGDQGSTATSVSDFMPKFGVLVPQYNFYDFNTKRSSELEDWEYPRTNLIFMRELGEGEFGKVVLMKAKGIAGYSELIPVAVKTLSSTEQKMKDRFMEEASLMQRFLHPHIVSLLGVSLSCSDETAAPLMILEYMPYGDLRYFLKTYRPAGSDQASITLKHFYSFAVDVAKALEFLAENKYVHRDVAARNCLVGPGLRIKIADFGLARGVNEKDYYQVTGRAVLPIRWMAPESLLYGRFSTSSDVWSYGVLLLEITSYGETPLKGLDPKEIMQLHVKQEVTYSRPDNCPDIFYALMQDCCDYREDNRPSFTDILHTLRSNRTQSCSSVLSVV